ncbi:MAG: DoxX family protein [Verrucomicrobia bacterium]|nr:MAG: DoxX family protein [Verrucomicrobiota bacterium]
MLSSLSKFRDFGLLLLRLVIGIWFIWHGWPLLAAGPHKWTSVGSIMKHLEITFSPAFWGFMAAFSQVAGGALFVLGLFLRPATLLLAVTMGVATFECLHKGEPFAKWSEPAAMTIVFIAFLFIGAGRYSFDKD